MSNIELNNFLDIYYIIACSSDRLADRRKMYNVRQAILQSGFVKQAFDTRRINQEVDYIPRRGLQNYHRSEDFISESMSVKIEAFTKLFDVLSQLKLEFGKQAAWQDSYARSLYSSVSNGLRTNIKDGDYSDSQPALGGLNYLEELLYVRYRLTTNDLLSKSSEDIRKTILNRDELLVHGDISDMNFTSDGNKNYEALFEKMMATMTTILSNYKPIVTPASDDNLTNKLFDVKATKENPNIERTVTITIKDNIDKKHDTIKVADDISSDITITSEEDE
jgi:hypothetical protein